MKTLCYGVRIFTSQILAHIGFLKKGGGYIPYINLFWADDVVSVKLLVFLFEGVLVCGQNMIHNYPNPA